MDLLSLLSHRRDGAGLLCCLDSLSLDTGLDSWHILLDLLSGDLSLLLGDGGLGGGGLIHVVVLVGVVVSVRVHRLDTLQLSRGPREVEVMALGGGGPGGDPQACLGIDLVHLQQISCEEGGGSGATGAPPWQSVSSAGISSGLCLLGGQSGVDLIKEGSVLLLLGLVRSLCGLGGALG